MKNSVKLLFNKSTSIIVEKQFSIKNNDCHRIACSVVNTFFKKLKSNLIITLFCISLLCRNDYE